MRTLIALSFPDPDRAETVRQQLLSLQSSLLVDLEDAAVVVRKEDGKVKLHQTVDLTARGTLSGGFWGTLLGLIFMSPIAGLAAGMAVGAISGALADIGIEDAFMKKLGKTLQPGSSAVFFLVRQAALEKVMDRLHGLKDATVLHTNLDVDDERELRELVESNAHKVRMAS